MTHQSILRQMETEKIKFIHLQFVDIQGTLKEIIIPDTQLETALSRGIWFDGSSIEGFVRIFESDMILMPDVSTFTVLPWTEGDTKSARFICDVHKKNDPFVGDPRSILKKTISKAETLGYTSYMGPEVEFFLLEPTNGEPHPLPHDEGGYFDASPQDLASEIRKKITLTLQEMNIQVETAHHEVATSQHEISLKYNDALTMADSVITLKYIIRSIAHQYNLDATFMPKPYFGINGSGMHTHQSLFKGDINVFYEHNNQYNLSDTALHYVAGLMDHAAALTAIASPTVNSFKRLVAGYEAPIYVCWAHTNRAAWIRIPNITAGREQSCRIELRSPDPSCNPYLSFACMLAAGLDGVNRKLIPPAAVEENVYLIKDEDLERRQIRILPKGLPEAIEALKQDPILTQTLGDHTTKKIIEVANADWNDYQKNYNLRTSDWEIERYLNR